MKTIVLFYKCHCMQDQVTLTVRQRVAYENVVDWIEEVVRPALTEDHGKRSPLCFAGTVEYLKIPVDDNQPVGNRATVQ